MPQANPKPAPIAPAASSPLRLLGLTLTAAFALALVLVGAAVLISIGEHFVATLVPPSYDATHYTFWWSAVTQR